MCGIVGILTAKPFEIDLEPALDLLRHRGPDDSGVLYWMPGETPRRNAVGALPCRIALGHRRLSIIDLSSAGRQPMSYSDGRWWIVFNGEVYNYLELRTELESAGIRFRTKTDTEVVLMSLVHWGPEIALLRFRGMFAIALLDIESGSLLLARDPFGIKPLFVCQWREGLAFASEIAPLLTLPGVDRSLNPDRTWQYLRFGATDHGSHTMLKGICQVPPAHWGRHSIYGESDNWTFRPYWDPRAINRCEISFEDAVVKVRQMFLQNIALHLRSDVPVGAALSGGIDSSAIVCAIRYLNPDQEIHTFSYLADDARLNEEVWVDIVNQHINAIPHAIRPAAEDLMVDLEKLMECQGEPFGSTSIYAQNRVFRAARDAGIKVMLDGQGADEILGGYTPSQGARFASLLAQGKLIDAMNFLRAQSAWPDRSFLSVLSTGIGLLLPDVLRHVARKLAGKHDSPIWANALWFQEREVDLKLPSFIARNREYLRSILQESVASGFLTLLRYEDRNSMAYSIESRVPFLTIDFVELLLSLPESHLIGNDGTSKCVFRAAMRGIVPDAILDRRDKIGFATPELAWLRQHRSFIEPLLSVASSVPCLDASATATYCRDSISGTRPFSSQVWRMVNFLHWHKSVVKGSI